MQASAANPMPVYISSAPDAVWGVAGRNEVSFASSGLGHIELDLMQIKHAVKGVGCALEDLGRRARCAERRQQLTNPSPSED